MVTGEHADTALIWTDDPGVAGFGSGLLIATNLVLTARHVVVDNNFNPFSGLKVRLQRDPEKECACSVVWFSKIEDLALVRLEGAFSQPAFVYRFAALENSFPITSVKVTGYPTATRTRAGNAFDYTVYGSLGREGANALSFSVAWADAPATPLDWAGISGGALFTTLAGSLREIFGVVQEERTKFKNGKIFIAPASEAALDSAFRDLVQGAGLEFHHRVVDLSLRQRAAQTYDFLNRMYEFAISRPPHSANIDFEIDLAVSSDFEELKQIIRKPEECKQRTKPAELLPRPADSYAPKRTYLQAPGGYGKSTFVKRVVAAAIEEGMVAFYLDAGKSSKTDAENGEDFLAELFKTGVHSGGTLAQFKRTETDSKAVVFLAIDGLNETVKDWSRVEVLLDYLKEAYPRMSLLIADRMNANRPLPDGFERATLLPIEVALLPDDKLRALVERKSTNKLLSIPFFLDLFYQQRESAEALEGFQQFGRADIIGRYVAKYAGGVNERKRSLENLAVEAYRAGSPIFDADLIGRCLPDGPEQLIGAGIACETEDRRYAFVHQLVHDYLAASWLAEGKKDTWTRENFDPVTLHAQSFDALELTAELLDQEAAEFVIAVYNWNYRAALDCILNLDAGLSGKESPLPVMLKDAVFALRAEKKFDPFSHTLRSAEARSREFRSSCGIDYAGVQSMSELLEQVASRYSAGGEGGGLYARWKCLFLREEGLGVPDWTAIQDSPLIGWTAASVFRRPGILSAALVSYLIELFGAMGRAHLRSYYPAEAIRWRIVHVLGAADGAATTGVLTAAVSDAGETSWVRYGAVRSLVEQASRAATLEGARALLATVITALPSMPPIVRKEIGDIAILGGEPPLWWREAYSGVLSAGLKGCADDTERKMWQNAVERLNRSVGVNP